MNILLLLSGYASSVNSFKDTRNLNANSINMKRFLEGFDYYSKLLGNNNKKIICSIWDNIGKNEVENYYKPEICTNHIQSNFQEEFAKLYRNDVDKIEEKRAQWFKENNLKDDNFVPISRYASQLFIRQQVCREAYKFMEISKFKPQIIILSRFDIGSRGGISIRNPIQIKKSIFKLFAEKNSIPFVLMPEFNQLNMGYPDMWYFLNQNSLKKMLNLYDIYINSIFNQESDYAKKLTKGWPNSEWYIYENNHDRRQFSNTVISKKKSDKLMQYHYWDTPNIHMYYKYFFSLRKNPIEVVFSEKFLSYFAMLKFKGFKYYFISILNEKVTFIKSIIKLTGNYFYNLLSSIL